MSIKMIKEKGKEAFKANYWRCVLVAFIMGLLTVGTGISSGNNARNGNSNVARQGIWGGG